MTVAELIAKLREFPPHLEIVGYDASGEDCSITIYRRDNKAEVTENPANGPFRDQVVIDVD